MISRTVNKHWRPWLRSKHNINQLQHSQLPVLARQVQRALRVRRQVSAVVCWWMLMPLRLHIWDGLIVGLATLYDSTGLAALSAVG